MSGNKKIWEKEWSSQDMKTVPGHASNEPSDDLILFRGYLMALGIKPPKKVIDIGSGKGRNAIYLAKEGFEVCGVEYIDTAVKHASEQSDRQGINSLTHFVLADVSKPWEFSKNYFDIAIDSLTSVGLEIRDRKICRDEMYRSLKKGGIALVRVVSADDTLEQELMKAHPGPEPNSSIWPETGKFQKNFTEKELRSFYNMFNVLTLEKRTKKAIKIGREFMATNWWVVLRKI